jgi:hypothetical protein
MAVLGPMHGVDITPSRPTSDGLGNFTFVDQAVIHNAVFALSAPSSIADSVYSQAGSLFVPRGSDLRNGDRIPYAGRFFVVIGPPQWDMDHPFTGEDFGYVEVVIQWGG